ncbi:hypothetical protein ECG_00614 [Echinococcus granulosus]|uniref:Uncharacterized protein n=1 Tax=Echinococcus granulosus TaxID=6210 RepID=A0A068WFU1_ECHGR|nr:hypothetical protein ECG_00614 [Echinococcus granulosus]CDS16534.1 hypothetical protein EgrG_002020000 [Echinococcus granulosus]
MLHDHTHTAGKQSDEFVEESGVQKAVHQTLLLHFSRFLSLQIPQLRSPSRKEKGEGREERREPWVIGEGRKEGRDFVPSSSSYSCDQTSEEKSRFLSSPSIDYAESLFDIIREIIPLSPRPPPSPLLGLTRTRVQAGKLASYRENGAAKIDFLLLSQA